MKTTVAEALFLSLAMALIILLCRALPFLFSPLLPKDKNSGSKTIRAFLDFIERIAPPAAMTVLAFNALGPSLGAIAKGVIKAVSSSPLEMEFYRALAVIAAVTLTALTHVWKRNALLSIFGGTAVYMILDRTIAR